MKNTDHRAVFLPSGEVNRQMLGRAACEVIVPLVGGISKVARPSAPAAVWLCHTVTALYNMGQSDEFVDALKLLYALAGLAPPPDMEPLVRHPVAANCFMLSCLSVVEELTEGATPLAVG